MEGPPGPRPEPKLESTQGIYENGEDFQETDEWQNVVHLHIKNEERGKSVSHPWTGRTVFIIDRQYSKEYGTAQRRQRATIANRINHKTMSWCENLIMPDS